jgi:hypothetical protein
VSDVNAAAGQPALACLRLAVYDDGVARVQFPGKPLEVLLVHQLQRVVPLLPQLSSASNETTKVSSQHRRLG